MDDTFCPNEPVCGERKIAPSAPESTDGGAWLAAS
jgi:hypothetical protein